MSISQTQKKWLIFLVAILVAVFGSFFVYQSNSLQIEDYLKSRDVAASEVVLSVYPTHGFNNSFPKTYYELTMFNYTLDPTPTISESPSNARRQYLRKPSIHGPDSWPVADDSWTVLSRTPWCSLHKGSRDLMWYELVYTFDECRGMHSYIADLKRPDGSLVSYVILENYGGQFLGNTKSYSSKQPPYIIPAKYWVIAPVWWTPNHGTDRWAFPKDTFRPLLFDRQ